MRRGLNQPASTDYAESRGKIAACVECGGHEDASSVDIARESILKALRHLGMISGREEPPRSATVIEFSNVVFKKGEGHLSRDWRHLDAVVRGRRPGGVQRRTASDRRSIRLYPSALFRREAGRRMVLSRPDRASTGIRGASIGGKSIQFGRAVLGCLSLDVGWIEFLVRVYPVGSAVVWVSVPSSSELTGRCRGRGRRGVREGRPLREAGAS